MLIDISGQSAQGEKGGDRPSINKRAIEGIIRKSNTQSDLRSYRKAIRGLTESDSLVVHFQPILSATDGNIYGYEALTRITSELPLAFDDVGDMFRKAREADAISSLDLHCRRNAIRDAALLGINDKGSYLFINICPETVMDPAYRIGMTDEIAEQWGMPKEKIILELSEVTVLKDYRLFKEAIALCRAQGYKIAIDDFGAGLGGLKILSDVEPNYVKIDRHSISGIDKNLMKFNMVESVATACHRIGIKVIAEGVEQQEEVDVIVNMGVELLQGYLLGKPSLSLAVNEHLFATVGRAKTSGHKYDENSARHFDVIGDICRKVESICPAAPFSKAVGKFSADTGLRGLPVVENGTVYGMLHRTRFTEQQILGRFGYGRYLNSYKDVGAVMERHFLLVDANTSLETVAQRVNDREAVFLYDDLVVATHGKYLGTVAVSDLLEAMTERSISTAKNSNPLSGLPGNVSIQKEIEKRLSQQIQFDACYIDLDHFKSYNDHYGFEKGDMVILSLAGIISKTLNSVDKDLFNFVGHIGGDDFILLTRPSISVTISQKIVQLFLSSMPDFHGTGDFNKGFYTSINRKGDKEKFDLLSLSIGIVSTEVSKIDSYAQLASIATEVKKLAKMQKGCAIVRDRRTNVHK